MMICTIIDWYTLLDAGASAGHASIMLVSQQR
jgi:hypothetical protein